MPCVSSRANGSSRCVRPRSRNTRVEEARVDQVQDRVLDAAAVEVDRPPVADLLRIERQLVVLRIAEPEEVPRRVDERVHRVGLAAGRAAALRDTSTLTNSGTCASGESPRPVNSVDLRQHDRQVVVRHGHHAALLAVDHRNRRAPVALPRDAPVLQPVLDRRLRRCPALRRVRGHRCPRVHPTACRRSDPECTSTPSLDTRLGHRVERRRRRRRPDATTTLIGRLYLRANSKSR